jgi:hypothetical protein
MRKLGLVFALGVFAALVLRLLFFRAFAENYDSQSYQEVVRVMASGGDPYGGTDRYNYSPVWAGTLAVLDVAARASGLSLATAVGALLLLADALTALLLFRLGGGGAAGGRAALLFFANPVSIWLSSYHRSFDAIAILLLLVALRIFRSEPLRPGRVSAALAASLLLKHVAAFHPLLFLRSRRRPGLGPIGLAAPYAVFLASFVPFWRSWRPIRDHVLLYGGLGGLYGTDALLLLPGVPFWVPRILFAAAVLTAVVLLRRAEVEPVRASLVLFLVVLIFLPGIGRQYFVWPIALGALGSGPGYLVYSVIATGALVSVSGLAPGLPHLPGWYGVWWACLLWLLLEWKALGRARRPA